MTVLKSGILLDRDGTVNYPAPFPEYTTNWDEFRFLPGVLDALRAIKAAGFLMGLVTNQPCIDEGIATRKQVEQLHDLMQLCLMTEDAAFDAIEYCSSPDPDHPDNKPNPGMLLKIMDELGIDPAQCVMIGDSHVDINAGKAAGVYTILVTDHTWPHDLRKAREAGPDATYKTLYDAIRPRTWNAVNIPSSIAGEKDGKR